MISPCFWEIATFHFAIIDPQRPVVAVPGIVADEDDVDGDPTGTDAAWHAPLAACWREVATRSAAREHADDREALAHADATIVAVERAVVGLMTRAGAPRPADPRDALCCAARALDATALVWHRLRPSAGRRFGTLGAQLHERAGQAPGRPSAALAAASARTAVVALDRLAVRAGPADTALELLEGASVTLACVAIQVWGLAQRRSGGRGPARTRDRRRAVHRRAADVLDRAVELGAAPDAGDSAGDWLAMALARPAPALALALIDDHGTDRVLSTEASSIAHAEWVSRGAIELLALRSLARESLLPSIGQPPWALHHLAVARATRRPAMATQTNAQRAWRGHSLALARTTGTYLRSCSAQDVRPRAACEELLDLLADSLAQAAILAARLAGDGDEGRRALRR